ncbi:MAG: 2-phosphosulfolactate phosphatase [Muribaculum sp.]|nr:2-phosphosulfolactate phosphatase [Ruminococcus flavefaciens]MCM1373660.1 2-phosphosulfolactate phosphatase [Muribaculum sp.]
MCDIKILHFIEGAKQAEGLTVIIDVFRAFSLECYLYDMGVRQIRPVGTLEEAFSLKRQIPDSILIGERHGIKCDGFDYGNSPSAISRKEVAGKIAIHTTSAGTQGIVNAAGASEIITGSLVNAQAVVAYIKDRRPPQVSLVCMGNEGIRTAPEDELCAEYIESCLEGRELTDLEQRISDLKHHGGEHFFDPSRQHIFPEADFYMCVQYNQFPFVIKVDQDGMGYVASRLAI